MDSKTTVRVMIGGKIITLGGFESEEYLQKIANYVDHKVSELEAMPGYKRLTPDMRGDLLAINIADDYFKAKAQVETLDSTVENKDKETYDIKHELVSVKIENEKLKQQIDKLKTRIQNK